MADRRPPPPAFPILREETATQDINFTQWKTNLEAYIQLHYPIYKDIIATKGPSEIAPLHNQEVYLIIRSCVDEALQPSLHSRPGW